MSLVALGAAAAASQAGNAGSQIIVMGGAAISLAQTAGVASVTAAPLTDPTFIYDDDKPETRNEITDDEFMEIAAMLIASGALEGSPFCQ